MTKNRALVDALEADFRAADIPRSDMVMLAYVEKLTRNPCSMVREDCNELRAAGFEDDQILDIVQVVSYFAFVNRLACGLGVELESYWKAEKP